jgi:tetratricopeptide (TPR) repeat protein
MTARPFAFVPVPALALAVALALAGATTRTATAQPKVASPEEIARAKELTAQATTAYKAGKFADALAGYTAAYDLYRAPPFLFNIAQCHFQLQHWDRAIFFFEGYLRELPDAKNRALVEELMEEARQRRAEQQEAERKRLELEQERLDLQRAREREAAERARLALSLRKVEAPPERPVYKTWWFWGLVGGAVAGVAVTAAVAGGDSRTVLPEGSLGTWDRR